MKKLFAGMLPKSDDDFASIAVVAASAVFILMVYLSKYII